MRTEDMPEPNGQDPKSGQQEDDSAQTDAERQAEHAHWTMISMWLSGLSVVPAGVTAYIALQVSAQYTDPTRVATVSLAVISILATLSTFLLTSRLVRSEATELTASRRAARWNMRAFAVNAFAMSAAWIWTIAESVISTMTGP